MTFDIAFIGHYTKDTIVYPTVTRVVDGGAFNYGANVAARLGLRVAVATRLAREDWHVVKSLEMIGVTVFAKATPHSTCLRLIYPTDDLDQRTIELTTYAEVVLAPAAADRSHRVFSNLFVEAQWLPEAEAILATRRPRSPDEQPPWMFHLLRIQAGRTTPASWETSRERFLGRTRSVERHPSSVIALMNMPFDPQPYVHVDG